MTGEVRHACTAYLTFVHLGPDMRPQPCRPFVPETPVERRRWHEALERRERRLERVKQLRRPRRTNHEHRDAAQNFDEQGKVRALCRDIHGGRRSSARRARRTSSAGSSSRRSFARSRWRRATAAAIPRATSGSRRPRSPPGRPTCPRTTSSAPSRRAPASCPGEQYEEITYEGYGSGGVAVLVQVLTDNKNRTGPEIRHIFEKNERPDGHAGLRGVDVRPARADPGRCQRIKEDELLEKALEAGAADVKQVEKAFEIATAPDEMETVRQGLERAGRSGARGADRHGAPIHRARSTARTPRRCCG